MSIICFLKGHINTTDVWGRMGKKGNWTICGRCKKIIKIKRWKSIGG